MMLLFSGKIAGVSGIFGGMLFQQGKERAWQLSFIAGLIANKFDEMATITNFLIVPLSFLSGTFYSIQRLPDLLQTISYYNPFFHMIDGFRYSFINDMDGSIQFGLMYLTFLSIIIWYIAYLLYKKGYKIKT